MPPTDVVRGLGGGGGRVGGGGGGVRVNVNEELKFLGKIQKKIWGGVVGGGGRVVGGSGTGLGSGWM